MLFRRLAVFHGGFDVDAAQAVAGDADAERYHVLDQLTLLVDKSLVVADDSSHGTRFRLMDTVRSIRRRSSTSSREGDDIRGRHRDHYAAMAAILDTPAYGGYQRRVEQADTEIDNLRAAFAWSREHSDTEQALMLASSLQPLVVDAGTRAGRSELADRRACRTIAHSSADVGCTRGASADKALLLSRTTGSTEGREEAEQVVATGIEELGDPALALRALTSCGALQRGRPRGGRTDVCVGDETRAGSLGDSRSLAQIIALDLMTGRVQNEPPRLK